MFINYSNLFILMMFKLDMSFGGAGQKFPISGLGFDGQPGIGASPGSLLGNEMVMYPIFDNTSSFYSK